MGILTLTRNITLEFDWSMVYSEGEIAIFYKDMGNALDITKSMMKMCVTKMFIIRNLMTNATSFSEKYDLYKWLNIYAHYFYISVYDIIDDVTQILEEETSLGDLRTDIFLLKERVRNFNKTDLNADITYLLESLLSYLNLPSPKFDCESCMQVIHKEMSQFNFEEYKLRSQDSTTISKELDLHMRVLGSNLQLWSGRYDWTASVDIMKPIQICNYLLDYKSLTHGAKFKDLKLKVVNVPLVYVMSLSRQMGVM